MSTSTKHQPPYSHPGESPSQYATRLAEWAGTDVARLAAAFLAGNGRVQGPFLRRVDGALLAPLRDELAKRPPLPFSSSPFGVFEVNREARRRGVEL